MWIESPPARCHPLVEASPDSGTTGLIADLQVTVTIFPFRADLVEECAAWCGGTVAFVNGAPALIVDGAVASLGDYVVEEDGAYLPDRPGGFDQRYLLA